MSIRVLTGDCREVLATLPEQSVQTCVTSPPYWGLRDYGTATWEGGDATCDHIADPTATKRFGNEAFNENRPSRAETKTAGYYASVCPKCGATRVDAQLGLERTPDEYVAKMVEVFRAVRRVLRDDGTLWLNLGDSYAAQVAARQKANMRKSASVKRRGKKPRSVPTGLKPKDLVGIPWRVAFALQADGWYLRSDIIWHKPNPMPESVTDRPTKAHEYLFLLTKNERYYYDADAIAEPVSEFLSTTGKLAPRARYGGIMPSEQRGEAHLQPNAQAKIAAGDWNGFAPRADKASSGTRNRRSVWTVATQPYSGAHFATFPPNLIEPCILAGSAPQACEHCGAAWVRVVEKPDFTEQPKRATCKGAEFRNGDRTSAGQAWQDWRNANPDKHLGFAPSCDCENNQGTARSVVLDPFGGAGTTGLVADRLGRDAILIELNPEYANMSRERTTDDCPLFVEVRD